MPADINPAMLILAREYAGLTQKELAERAGISQSKVSKYESGILRVSDGDLAEISRVVDFPRSFFEQTDKVYGFGSACFYHRKRQAMPVNELRIIHAKSNILRMHVHRLMRGVEIETDNRFCRMDIDDYGSPEEVARKIRGTWSLPMGPIQDLVAAIENAGGIVWKLSFGTRRLDAVSQVAPGMPPIFIINADIPGDRLRYTLAHELGHILMHHTPNVEMERQADQFASEFLMPAAECRSWLRRLSLHKLPDLKRYWKVSMAALIKRAFDVGEITERHYRTLFTQISKHGWRVNEPVEIATEEPSVLRDMLAVHFRELRLSGAEICEMLATNERTFAELYAWTQQFPLRVVV
jgi:Zn-dependent peptidase ImmA (M78 family)/DNA-binding XRE family transcriptional regulator